MTRTAVATSLPLMFSELINGARKNSGYMLNGGDVGMLRSLDRLSARAASKSADRDGATIAAHVDHVRYGIELMNRWYGGEPDPWATADWTASWKRTKVDEREWKALRAGLRREVKRWEKSLAAPRAFDTAALSAMVASIAHLAYHLGAIRQIERSARGPKADISDAG